MIPDAIHAQAWQLHPVPCRSTPLQHWGPQDDLFEHPGEEQADSQRNWGLERSEEGIPRSGCRDLRETHGRVMHNHLIKLERTPITFHPWLTCVKCVVEAPTFCLCNCFLHCHYCFDVTHAQWCVRWQYCDQQHVPQLYLKNLTMPETYLTSLWPIKIRNQDECHW